MHLNKKYLILSIFVLAIFVISNYKSINIKYPNADTIQVNQNNVNYTNLNNNSARNWKLANEKPLVQQLNNGQITYQILSTDNLYIKAYKTAINNWNKLGVVKLVATNNNPQITMSGNYNDAHNNYDGLTTYNVDANSLNNNLPYSYLENVNIELSGQLINRNNKNIFKYLMINAEHEIGHALGFAHDDSIDKNYNVYVMETDIDLNYLKYVNPLGNYEKQTLLNHYALQLNSNLVNNIQSYLNKHKTKLSKVDKKNLKHAKLMMNKYKNN